MIPTHQKIDKIKIQTIFSYWKLPYINGWFIFFSPEKVGNIIH